MEFEWSSNTGGTMYTGSNDGSRGVVPTVMYLVLFLRNCIYMSYMERKGGTMVSSGALVVALNAWPQVERCGMVMVDSELRQPPLLLPRNSLPLNRH